MTTTKETRPNQAAVPGGIATATLEQFKQPAPVEKADGDHNAQHAQKLEAARLKFGHAIRQAHERAGDDVQGMTLAFEQMAEEDPSLKEACALVASAYTIMEAARERQN